MVNGHITMVDRDDYLAYLRSQQPQGPQASAAEPEADPEPEVATPEHDEIAELRAELVRAQEALAGKQAELDSLLIVRALSGDLN